MPSPELEQLVIALDAKEPRKRIKALEDMWELRDPEAIVFLSIIYTEDENKKVRTKAGEILANYKGMYEALQGRGGGGASSGLRNLLMLTLVLFIGLNVLLFMASNSESSDEGSGVSGSPQEQRSALLGQMQQDMETTETIARDLRSRATDYSDGLESLGVLCGNALPAIPEAVSLSEQQQALFPDIQETVSNEIGNYRFSLAALKTATSVWNGACADPDNAVLDARQIIELTLETIDTATAAQNTDIQQLLDEPYATPMPTAVPTATTTPTPEPSPTPAARTREVIVETIVVQPQRVQADAQEILNRLSAINAGADARAECGAANFWNPPGIELTREEETLFEDIALYGANPDSLLNKALTSLGELKTAWEALCEDGRASASEISLVTVQAERLLTTIPFLQEEFATLFGG